MPNRATRLAGTPSRRSLRRPQPSNAVVKVPAAGTALLLIDVINDLVFPGAAPLIEAAEAMATRLAQLKRRAVRAGIPVVYVNDNFGRWRSDFRHTVKHCTAKSSPGRLVSSRLRPTTRDYFVLKPKHSGFHASALDTLLQDLGIRRVIVTGIAGNICVLFTANDAYMRGLRIIAPADCIASNTRDENDDALRQIQIVLKGTIQPSHLLTFRRRRARTTASQKPGGKNDTP